MPERELDEARAVRHNGATDAEFEAAGIMNPGPRSSRLQSRMVYDCPSPADHPPPPRSSLTAVVVSDTYDDIAAQHLESLHRLGTSYIDSCVIHNVDQGYHDTALAPPGNLQRMFRDLKDGGGFRKLEELRAAGEIKAIGAGVNYELRNFEFWEGTPGFTPMEQLVTRIADVSARSSPLESWLRVAHF